MSVCGCGLRVPYLCAHINEVSGKVCSAANPGATRVCCLYMTTDRAVHNCHGSLEPKKDCVLCVSLRRGEDWSQLTRRQRQRRREATYWDRALVHSLAQLERVKRQRFIVDYKMDNAALREALHDSATKLFREQPAGRRLRAALGSKTRPAMANAESPLMQARKATRFLMSRLCELQHCSACHSVYQNIVFNSSR